MSLAALVGATLALHVVRVPFDKGANVAGSAAAPDALLDALLGAKPELIDGVASVQPGLHVAAMLDETSTRVRAALDSGTVPLVLGGDHSVAIGSVAASAAACAARGERLGVLWCDAHADFNTIRTSPTGNLHGVPVAVLCGHTLPTLALGPPLSPRQFAFYGLRDMDAQEFERFQQHDMTVVDNPRQLSEWVRRFDRVHVSFDVDCLDPSVGVGCNTPVREGRALYQVEALFAAVRSLDKLLAVDVVELNPRSSAAASSLEKLVRLIAALA